MSSPIDRQSVRYRPLRDDDTEFLASLYASTRTEEMKLVPWTEEQKVAFLRMQFDAQTYHYHQEYDRSGFFIVEQDGAPVGRLYRERQADDIHVIDISIIPELRGRGLGTMLLREILDEAAGAGLTVSIYVEHYNPAKRLYHRLGFQEVGENGVYHLLKWQATRE
jgi:ribosomal protein S18 acetylase RimI-like enzyme